MAIEVEAVQTVSRGSGAGFLGGLRLPRPSISPRERAFLTERLQLLLETGHALHPSLDIITRQCGDGALADVVAQLRDDIAGGATFSAALARHGSIFDTTYVNLVAAGERGGFLPDVLEQLSHLDAKAAELRTTVISAFSYPAFLATFSGGVVIFVLVVVFPKFAEMFAVIRDQLPPTTLALMAASDLLRHHVGWILGGLGGLSGAGLFWVGTAGGRAAIDWLKLSIPGVRSLFVELYLTQMFWVLGLSLGHGVSVPDALRAARDVVRNRVFREFVEQLEIDVQEGRGVARGFERCRFMPALAVQMVATAEESGTLPLVLTRVAGHYERELGRRLKTFSKLIEPLMLLVMGAVVGVLVASLILPIFKLTKAVR